MTRHVGKLVLAWVALAGFGCITHPKSARLPREAVADPVAAAQSLPKKDPLQFGPFPAVQHESPQQLVSGPTKKPPLEGSEESEAGTRPAKAGLSSLLPPPFVPTAPVPTAPPTHPNIGWLQPPEFAGPRPSEPGMGLAQQSAPGLNTALPGTDQVVVPDVPMPPLPPTRGTPVVAPPPGGPGLGPNVEVPPPPPPIAPGVSLPAPGLVPPAPLLPGNPPRPPEPQHTQKISWEEPQPNINAPAKVPVPGPGSVVRIGYQVPPAGREPAVDAFQCVIDNRHQEALELLKAYDTGTQELFMRLLPAMALLTRKNVNQLNKEEVAVLHDQVQSLLLVLRPHTKLAIAKAVYCESATSFGNYKPLPEDYAFRLASDQQLGERVQVYVELRNFVSEQRQGFYETHLVTTLSILDGQGQVQWKHVFKDSQQPIRSRTPLHDHFTNYAFYVPAGLGVGEYRLLLHVEDRTRPNEPRVDEKVLPFRVTALAQR